MVQMIPALPVGTRRAFFFVASRQPELDREEYQSVGQSLRVSHLKLESQQVVPLIFRAIRRGRMRCAGVSRLLNFDDEIKEFLPLWEDQPRLKYRG